MKKIIFIGLLTFASFSGKAQVYEHIYEVSGTEVQGKIDQNKMMGIPILSDVHAKFSCGLVGVGITQKTTLNQLLTDNPEIINVAISDDASSIVIEAQATFTTQKLQQILMSLNASYISLTEDYFIQN